ncbi:MAG: flagellar basal-body rod protein FlgF [Caulobacterales bacterium 32-69-10]|nr:MAG: flagellar basal-body rod protein FlgF [Caulobacterales bacterium 32-69-10]
MNTVQYVGLSRQETLKRALEIAANNIANADTAGFKIEQQMVRVEEATPFATPGARPVAYVLDHGVARDFSQGGLEESGNAYDIAIEGDGFYAIQTADGTRYTRDGRFTVDAQNQLVTKMGDPVLGNNGRPIVLNPIGGEANVGKDGTISQGMVPVGRLGATRFADLSLLKKVGDNQFEAPADAVSTPAADAVMRQGMVERSNVQPVLEITNLIEITRAYERVARMMEQSGDLSTRAIDRLGRIN